MAAATRINVLRNSDTSLQSLCRTAGGHMPDSCSKSVGIMGEGQKAQQGEFAPTAEGVGATSGGLGAMSTLRTLSGPRKLLTP